MNIVMTAQGRYKMIDFESTWFREGTTLAANSLVGIVEYMSPEARKAIMDSSMTYNPFLSDVYSLGITLLRLAKLALPVDLNTGKAEVIRKVIQREIPQLPYSDNFKMLMTEMLQVDPSNRLPLAGVRAMVKMMLFAHPEERRSNQY